MTRGARRGDRGWGITAARALSVRLLQRRERLALPSVTGDVKQQQPTQYFTSAHVTIPPGLSGRRLYQLRLDPLL